MSFKGTLFCDYDLDQNYVSFMHIPNACLNCVASFKCLHQILLDELQRREQYYSVIW